MKVKVTLISENDRHPDATKEELEEAAKKGWDLLCSMYNSLSTEDRAFVEKCEIIEV